MSSAPHHNSLLVRFHAFAQGGEAVGRTTDGQVVFVPYAAPGDVARVRVTETHRSYLRGELVEICEPSPDRVLARCPHFGQCGACQWQHVDYAAQLREKRALVANALRHLDVAAKGPMPAASAYGTRRRVHMMACDNAIGYLAWSSHRFVPVNTCPIVEPRLWMALDRVRTTLRGEVFALAGPAGVTIRSDTGEQGAPVNLAAAGEPAFVVSADVFAQASQAGDSALAACVRDWAAVAGRSVLELYAGAGNFTRWLLEDGGQVTAVEGDARAFTWLAQNAPAAHCLKGDASQVVRDLVHAGRRFDVVVLDPPRAGAKSLLADIMRCRPERLVYVSCNPMTLARDLASLTALGLRVTHVRVFDLMPQTSHVEIVALAICPNRD